MSSEQRLFRAEWHEPSYVEDSETVTIDFFTEDKGYDPEDIERIQELEVGKVAWMGLGDHSVLRLPNKVGE